MRERLVAAFLALTAAGLLLFGLPRAYQLAGLVEDQQRTEVARTADQSAHLVGVALDAGVEVTPRLLAGGLGAADTVSYRAPDGIVVTAVARDDARDDRDDDLSVTRLLPSGGSVTVTRSAAAVDEKVGSALLWLVVPGVVLLATSLAAGLLLARRLSRPFEELARAADRLGGGEFDLAVPRQRVPEADRLAITLNDSARRLEALVQRERELAVDASHLLRTPVTAIRLGLEDLASWPETHPVVHDELHRMLAELDRLSRAVTGLVEHPRTSGPPRGEAAALVGVLREELPRLALLTAGPSGAAYPRAAARDLARAVGRVTGAEGRAEVEQRTDLVRLSLSNCAAGLTGLRGLQEAAAALGGSVAADAASGRVTVWLPVDPDDQVRSGG